MIEIHAVEKITAGKSWSVETSFTQSQVWLILICLWLTVTMR